MIKQKLQDKYTEIGEFDENGFLRIRLRLGRLGVLPYKGAEIEGFEDEPERMIPVLRDEAALFEPESMKSGEGVPVFIDHNWLEPEKGNTGQIQIGAIAGTLKRDGDYLVGEAKIINQVAIEKIRNLEVIETSPGVLTLVDKQSGIWRDSEPYEAVQSQLRYNHWALLPKGKARGGEEMKITDKKSLEGDVKMSVELVKVKTPHGMISTDAGGEQVLSRFMDAVNAEEKQAAEDKASLMDQMGDLKGTVEKVEALNEQIAALQAEKEKLMGELDTVKGELDRIASPDVMAANAAELVESQEDAKAIAEDSLPADWKRLPVNDLKRTVVEIYNRKKGRVIDAAELTEPYIKGVWETLVELKRSAQPDKFVPVRHAVMDSNTAPVERSPLEMLGYRAKKKEA